MALGCVMAIQGAWAATQTTPYIAIHSQPLYANLAAMPYANAKAPKGGYLSTASNGTFDNLNSMNGKGSSADGVNYLFDSLMSSSLDEPGVMYPLLATSATFDPKKTSYVIFNLNPKARFSDGSTVTAEDVKFSFDAYQTKSNPGLQMYLADLAKTEVLSKHQVKMSFKSDNNAEMPLILSQLPIYSKKDWAKKDFTRISMQPILGSGPYVLDKIDAGRSLSYKRNPNYWAKDLPVNKGRYNFDRLKYVYYRNLDIAFEGFKSGQYTLHEEFTARKWVTAYNFPAVKDGMVVKYRFKHNNPIATQSFVFNTRRSPFQDIRLRQALTYAYDFEWQNKALFYGQYTRLQSYFSNSELEAKGVPSAAEMAVLKPLLAKLDPIQRAGVLKNWKYPVSDASGFNRNNLLIARQLLLNAGYKYKNGYLLDKKGQTIQIEFLIHQDGLQRTLMPFVRNMKRLGIQVNIRQVDVPQYIERMRSKDFDMTTTVMPQSLSPGNEQAQFWGSASADQPGNYNYAGIKNPVIDAMVEQVIRAPDRSALVTRTRVLDRLLRAGYYQIPTYGKGENWLAYWNMYQQPTVKPKLSTGIDYWWSDAVQAQKVASYLRKQ
ncbi:ABC transporter substrate-binding protein [Acinetobacter cumulans]|uniref:ABC transporter substrate-binding protein n=1 Tax=Acinetobacter cumulans TaxID=2136182 RepID=A0A498D9N7_9GAMM|nr:MULTISPECIES: extracellular solute-binding protein [Acinetobacter]NWK74836.1 ABC transporter substrate-binding protein [Acinetobacter sp. SwsAc6]QCO22842.1 ABC transporter substrate-binding protein [Acinetobacter cumulans]RFS27865.1 ABC transporter substrate-binding protein [Acinetobacter sp. SWAC5]RKG47792.1 ABC transporter substrate-binding protein [Acinetobacter cumulans]RLL33811.1 ABC transporter substrate-binding protein [Acinetobacter cumulans]